MLHLVAEKQKTILTGYAMFLYQIPVVYVKKAFLLNLAFIG